MLLPSFALRGLCCNAIVSDSRGTTQHRNHYIIQIYLQVLAFSVVPPAE
jgi:hypothetical protein